MRGPSLVRWAVRLPFVPTSLVIAGRAPASTISELIPGLPALPEGQQAVLRSYPCKSCPLRGVDTERGDARQRVLSGRNQGVRISPSVPSREAAVTPRSVLRLVVRSEDRSSAGAQR